MGSLGGIIFLLKTFFFVYIGLSVKFADLNWLLFGGLLTLLLVVPRLPAVRVALRHRVPARDAALAACMLTKGLAAAVPAELIVQQALPGAGTVQSVIYAMIFFGVVVTSVLVFVANLPFGARVMAWLLGRASERVAAADLKARTAGE
ncbi:MAG: cation:proton antiporter [Terriglobales bacterium]